MSDNIHVHENKPDHHYRTEIPNIVFELGLDPYCLSIYMHLKRIAGDAGACWKSIPQLAKQVGIGETKFKSCLKILSSPFPLLSSPLITIIHRLKKDGSPGTCIIHINDIWGINGAYYRGKNANGGGGSPHDPGGSPRDYKEEPYKKNQTNQPYAESEDSLPPSSESSPPSGRKASPIGAVPPSAVAGWLPLVASLPSELQPSSEQKKKSLRVLLNLIIDGKSFEKSMSKRLADYVHPTFLLLARKQVEQRLLLDDSIKNAPGLFISYVYNIVTECLMYIEMNMEPKYILEIFNDKIKQMEKKKI